MLNATNGWIATRSVARGRRVLEGGRYVLLAAFVALAGCATPSAGTVPAAPSAAAPAPQAAPASPVVPAAVESPAEFGQADIGMSSTSVAEASVVDDVFSVNDDPVHVGWGVSATEQTPHTGRTFQLKIRQGPQGPKAADRRYKLEVTAGRKRHKVTDNFFEFRVPKRVKRVKVKVVDPRGGTYTESFSVNPNAKTIVEVTSKWAHPGYRGEFVNDRGDCRRTSRREKLRFSVWITRDLQIGDWVEVKPGQRVAGPRLTDGRYRVVIERRKRGRWVVVRRSKMTVDGKGWRSVAGCGVKG